MAALALAAATVGMLAVRSSLDKAHVALIYLIVVLGGSAAGGRALGITLAGLAFLHYDIICLPPYHTITVANPLDWLVLVAFLVTSIVATQLLDRAQERAAVAERHAAEVARLSALGAETLNAGRAEEALGAIAEVIRSTLDLDRCDVYVPVRATARTPVADADGSASSLQRGEGEIRLRHLAAALRSGVDPGSEGGSTAGPHGTDSLNDSLVAWVIEHGHAAAERLDGTSRIASRVDLRARPAMEAVPERGALSEDAIADLEAWHDAADTRALALPLQMRGRTVGVIRLASVGGLTLRPDQLQFLSALAYYAALGVDRVRLTAEAERAEALRETDRLRNAFLASVSHDIRTPLTSIKALANAIAASGEPRAQVIEEEADRLNHFVSDVLDMSRLSGGALPVRLEVETAEDVVGAALERVRAVIGDRRVEISEEPEGGVLVGRFDFVHTLHILANLLENSHKYSPSGTAIDLSVARRGSKLRFTIADRGPGVPEPERDRIFEPFYRGAERTADVGGVGLGLAIARGLADAQGGSLIYEPRPGGGSTFILELSAFDVTGEF
jgi:two-component system sensor histidine kinase KdpD